MLWLISEGNWSHIIQKLDGPAWQIFRKIFFPTDSSYQSLVDIFDNTEHLWFEEMTLACIDPQRGVFLQGLIFQDMPP